MAIQSSVLLSIPAQQDDILLSAYRRVLTYLCADYGGKPDSFLRHEINGSQLTIFGNGEAHRQKVLPLAANAIEYINAEHKNGNLNFQSYSTIIEQAIDHAKEASKKHKMREQQLEVGIDLTGLNTRQLNSWARVRAFLTETRNLVLKDALAEKPEDKPIGAREKPDRVVITQTESTPLEFLQIHFDAATKLALWAGKEIGKDHELTDNRIRHVYNNLVVDEARRHSVPKPELSTLKLGR
jgi:hypothetical protein